MQPNFEFIKNLQNDLVKNEIEYKKIVNYVK